jgi:2-desacetyl-2-hydroxyethyl bacteriochlorophyllide A dehydrogenase
MSEFLTVPTQNLHKSDKLTLEQLALVETLSIGAHAVRRAQLQPAEYVLVVGAGPIGLSIIQFALLAGSKVIVMDLNTQRLQFCQQHLNISHCINGESNPPAELRKILKNHLPTTVFDARGSGQSMMNSFNYVAHGGKLVFVGLFQGNVTFHDPHFHQRELTVMSSRNATNTDFQYVLSQLEAGYIDVSPWITHQVAFEDLITAFPSWLNPETGVVKAMVSL